MLCTVPDASLHRKWNVVCGVTVKATNESAAPTEGGRESVVWAGA